MDFENASPCYYSSSSPSSSSSQSQLSPNPEQSPPPDSSSSHARVHKKKAGRKKFRETRHPVYRGVRQRNGNRWVCEVREPNKKTRIWLGTYPTPEMAARAHDAAVLALRGTSAMFNFPESISLLPIARSSSPTDIQAAAAKASVAEASAPTMASPPSMHLASSSSTSTATNHFVDQTNYPCLVHDSEGRERVLEGDHVVVVDNTCTKDEIGNDEEGSKSMFFDEEALFNMPGLLDSMAEGLLITPPSMKRAFDWDHVECETDLNLWTD